MKCHNSWNLFGIDYSLKAGADRWIYNMWSVWKWLGNSEHVNWYMTRNKILFFLLQKIFLICVHIVHIFSHIKSWKHSEIIPLGLLDRSNPLQQTGILIIFVKLNSVLSKASMNEEFTQEKCRIQFVPHSTLHITLKSFLSTEMWPICICVQISYPK